jgi:hypothetical protein
LEAVVVHLAMMQIPLRQEMVEVVAVPLDRIQIVDWAPQVKVTMVQIQAANGILVAGVEPAL